MAGLRHGRPTCIRAAFSATGLGAGFRKRQRTARRRLQVSHRRNLLDFAEGIWREFLDSYDGDSEDSPSHPGSCAVPPLPPTTTTSKSAEDVGVEEPLPSKAPDLLPRAASWAPTALGANDVDMQMESEEKLPLEAGGPREHRGWCGRLLASPERASWEADPGPLAESDTGRHPPSRAKGTRLPSRLGSERDKGPRLLLSKRKLELLLAEPEKNKRRK